MNPRLSLLCMAVLLLAGCSRDKDNLVANGGFEEGPDPRAFTQHDAKDATIKGWTVTRGSIDYIGTYFKCAEGQRCIDLDGTGATGGLATQFSTDPGKHYHLSFALAANPQCPPDQKHMEVMVDDRVLATFTLAGTLEWSRRELKFTASRPVTRLEFFSTDPATASCGPMIDDVRVVRPGD